MHPVDRDHGSGRVAALDCGTNSTRLLVANTDGSSHSRFMRITRLGQGVDDTRRLAPEAVARTLGVLREYRQTMDATGVVAARLVATSATRDARNGQAFLQSASDVVGVKAELLSGKEEGRLAWAGATAGLASVAGDDVVVDIGGGSTELAVRHGEDVLAVSLDVGCVRLTERFLRHDLPTDQEIAAATSFLQHTLRHGVSVLPSLDSLAPDSRLLGLAGSVTTLAALELGLEEYDPLQTHHFVLTRTAVDRWCTTLCGEPASERARRPAIVEGREDVIAGGALILRQVMDSLGFEHCTVSETDILDGLAMSLLAR